MNSTKAEELKGKRSTLNTRYFQLTTPPEPSAKRAEREDIIREQWVKAMELRIVREQLSVCQKTEGVNHYENCKEWSERYLNMLGDSKVTGYRKIDV